MNGRILLRTAAVVVAVGVAGLAADALGQAPGTKRWEYLTGGEIHGTPAVGADGTVYVGSSDKKLHAVKRDGTALWQFTTGGDVGTPAVGPDGTLYVGSADNTLYAVSPQGSKLWVLETGNAITEPPAIGRDGTIYVVSTDGKLYALNPNGSTQWQYAVGGSMPAPSIGLDGTIYIGTADNSFYALNPNGSEQWKRKLPYGPALRSGVLDLDGTLYVVGDVFGSGSILFVLNADGSERLRTNLISDVPSIGPSGTLYFSDGNSLSARLRSLSQKWSVNLVTAFYYPPKASQPAVGADGMVYAAAFENLLVAADGNGNRQWEFAAGGEVGNPVIGGTGVVYVASADHKLYAVNCSSAGPAASAWPMYRRDAAHTANIAPTVLRGVSLSVTMFPGLLVTGSVGTSYRIEYTDKLGDTNVWSLLSTVTLDRTPYRYFDVGAANSTRRFYRAVVLP